ncbi:MAG: sialate O-acetylesterase [Runella sp.]
MTYKCCLIVFGVALWSVGTLRAQVPIKITFPTERAVFQRNNANQATISVGGYFTQPVDRIEARLVPVLPGQGQATDWTLIQTNPRGGTFLGSIVGRGGWYTLEVRAFNRGTQIGRDAIGRMGVGEVFVVAGQSNAEGIFNYGAPAPTEDRVNAVVWDNRNSDRTQNPTLSFTQMTAEMVLSPRGRSAWCWGALGDLLVRKLNVPVLFINAAWFDTSTQNWLDSAFGRPVANRIGGFLPLGMPYDNLKASLQYYGSILGMRAVLWLQGENDAAAGVSREAYQNALQGLVNVARNDQGDALSSVPWVLSRTSRVQNFPFTSQAIIDAQNAVINIPFNKCYAGPMTDNIQVPRPDGVHFQGQGLVDLANAWNNSLPPSFFATVVPVMARQLLPVTVTCNTPSVSANVRAPAGFASYIWSTGETTQTITISNPGTYQVTMKDNAGNTFLTAPFTLLEPVRPPTPVIVPSGEQIICADSSIRLSVNVSAANEVTWNTGNVGNSITVNRAGSYTASITNIFGCTSSTSAATTIKTLSIKAPQVLQSGPYSVRALVDSTIFGFTDTRVARIVYDWQQGGRVLPFNSSAIKVTEVGSFSARSRVTFVAKSGGSERTCVSPFSQAVLYQPSAKDDGLIVYANPTTTGWIALETLQDLTNVEIIVVSLAGQIVYQEKMEALTFRKDINLSYLAEGEYIIKLTASTFNQSRRFIIDY